MKHLKNYKALTDITIFILWYHKDETTAKKLVKINPIREQHNSCPPFSQGNMHLTFTEILPLLLLKCLTLYQTKGVDLLL